VTATLQVTVSRPSASSAMDVTKGQATAESQIAVALRLLVEGGTVTGTGTCTPAGGSTFVFETLFEFTPPAPIMPGTPYDIQRILTILYGHSPPFDLGALDCRFNGTDSRGAAVSATHSAPVPNSALQPNVTTCTPGDKTSCAFDRFEIEATSRNPAGETGPGVVAPNGRFNDGAYFWFFNDSNTQTLVQIRNRCNEPLPRFWVFASGLTNVEVNITVTDTQSGVRQTYTNPQGEPFGAITDTEAFATCP
jgi:hypothetical protein